jgi:hypothetical protein
MFVGGLIGNKVHDEVWPVTSAQKIAEKLPGSRPGNTKS